MNLVLWWRILVFVCAFHDLYYCSVCQFRKHWYSGTRDRSFYNGIDFGRFCAVCGYAGNFTH